MNDLEKIFDVATFKNGGLFQSTNEEEKILLEDIKYIGNNLINKKRLKMPQFPLAHIYFINNYKFNACAFTKDGHYFIGINIGVIRILEKLFNYIMSHQELLAEIGETSQEKIYKIVNDEYVSDYDYLKLFSNYDTEVYLPNNEERRDFAKILMSFAIEFLIYHEYAHIINGHIDYKKNTSNSSFMHELTAESNFNDGLFNQTLEMDADSLATEFSANETIDNWKYRIFPLKKIEEYLYYRFLSIHFVFRLLGEREYKLDSLKSKSHPVPEIRLSIVYAVLYEIFVGKQKEQILSGEKLKEVQKKIIIITDNILKKISEKTFKPINKEILFTDEGQILFFNIMSNWEYVRPKISPFSKNNLAPVSEFWKNAKPKQYPKITT